MSSKKRLFEEFEEYQRQKERDKKTADTIILAIAYILLQSRWSNHPCVKTYIEIALDITNTEK